MARYTYADGRQPFSVAASDADASELVVSSAKCTGTNDEVEINAALVAASAVGGIVQLSAGAYSITDPILLPSNVTLRGSGWETKLNFATHGASHSVIRNDDMVAGNSNIAVENLYIDGNKDNQTGWGQTDTPGVGNRGCVFFTGCDNVRVSHCRIDNAWAAGIETELSHEVWITDNRIDASADDGIGVNYLSYNVTVARNIISRPGYGVSYGSSSAIEIQDGSYNVSCFANQMFDLTAGEVFGAISVNSHSSIAACHDISIQGNVVTNGRLGASIKGNSDANDEAYGITITGNVFGAPSDRVVVTGTLSPDVTEAYLGNGTYQTKTAYQIDTAAGDYWIWWDNVDTWIISAAKGDITGAYWSQTNATVNGTYTAQNGATGEAAVTSAIWGVLLENTHDVIVSNNSINMNGSDTGRGILINATSKATIVGNRIFNGYTGIELSADTKTDITIEANAIETTYAGIDSVAASDLTNVRIQSNTFTDMTNGFFLREASGDSDYSECVLKDNSFIGTTISFRPYDGADIDTPFGWTVVNNDGVLPKFHREYTWIECTIAGGVAVGDVVILKVSADSGYGDSLDVTTTTTVGDSLVYGVAAETIANGVRGQVQTAGKCMAVKVNGTTDIAAGDLLGTYSEVKISQKAGTGECAFAMALEAYATNDSAGVIEAFLVSPRQAI